MLEKIGVPNSGSKNFRGIQRTCCVFIDEFNYHIMQKMKTGFAKSEKIDIG